MDRYFIGGSDAAAILGESDWSTPLRVYLEKRGEWVANPIEEEKKARIFKRGKRMEPLIRQMAEEEWGLDIVRYSTEDKPSRYSIPEYPFLRAEIDFEWRVTRELALALNLDEDLIGTVQNGEIKSAHPWAAKDKFGDEDTDQLRPEYISQALHGMMVTGAKLCLFAVLIGSDNLVRYVVHRDDFLIETMREVFIRFWNDHVLAGIPPEPHTIDDCGILFRRRPASTTEATEENLALAQTLKDLRYEIMILKNEEEQTKLQILGNMLGAETVASQTVPPGKHILMAGGAEILTVAMQSSKRIDSDKLRKQFPEVAAQCEKVTDSLVMRFPKR